MQRFTTVEILMITLISFGTYFILDEMYFRDMRSWLNGTIGQMGISHIVSYAVFGIPMFVGALIIHGRTNLTKSLGLKEPMWKGAFFAFLCTLPMFMGFAIFFKFNTELTLNGILINGLAAAFFEELYYRGFLFGQLYRYTKWGFIPSVLIGALVFGFVHIYQGTGLYETLGIFLITFLGGILFAWAYAEWNYNIWVPIFLHLFMNLAWDMFSVSDTALGGIYSNVFRVATIALIIILTLLYKKRNGMDLEVGKKSIWLRSESGQPKN
ncbi:MAG: lysostaphin resistance A-like protein [Flavobacteriaceae bacterium]